MKQFFRITAAVLAAAFLLAFTGCGSSSSAPSFTWFVDTIPANLDPQVASAAPDVIACENLYSGLVRKKADGEIVPDLSESWQSRKALTERVSAMPEAAVGPVAFGAA